MMIVTVKAESLQVIGMAPELIRKESLAASGRELQS
jgi:hypothetical protein